MTIAIENSASSIAGIYPLERFVGSLSNRVYSFLREAIFSLELRPGEHIRKDKICTKLNVSRSPVSEAIVKLSDEKLVNVIPQVGTYVSRLSMKDIREGAFLREALELAAVESIAGKLTEKQLMQLRRNLRYQRVLLEDKDLPAFYNVDAEMHQLIMSFTGYKRLVEVATKSWTQVDRARRLMLPTPGRLQQTYEEHAAIVNAIVAGDVSEARNAMKLHLSKLIVLLEPLETKHPELFLTKTTIGQGEENDQKS